MYLSNVVSDGLLSRFRCDSGNWEKAEMSGL